MMIVSQLCRASARQEPQIAILLLLLIRRISLRVILTVTRIVILLVVVGAGQLARGQVDFKVWVIGILDKSGGLLV